MGGSDRDRGYDRDRRDDRGYDRDRRDDRGSERNGRDEHDRRGDDRREDRRSAEKEETDRNGKKEGSAEKAPAEKSMKKIEEPAPVAVVANKYAFLQEAEGVGRFLLAVNSNFSTPESDPVSQFCCFEDATV